MPSRCTCTCPKRCRSVSGQTITRVSLIDPGGETWISAPPNPSMCFASTCPQKKHHDTKDCSLIYIRLSWKEYQFVGDKSWKLDYGRLLHSHYFAVYALHIPLYIYIIAFMCIVCGCRLFPLAANQAISDQQVWGRASNTSGSLKDQHVIGERYI